MDKLEKVDFEILWNKIDDYFNWKKVYKTMKALDWYWSFSDNMYAIPSVDTIKAKARRLLHDVYEQGKGKISTAGFIAGIEDGELWLMFSIEEAHTVDL